MEINFNVTFDNAQEMTVQFSEDSFNCDFGEGIISGDYDGPYVVTPTQETQTLATAGKTLESNVTVNPIPSNYGLITWDGSTITVS